ncbi:MAG TPA: hypothetical protein VK403_10245 [Allosphingosinicella sp.]|nr:hypothetical protein [Allosphingosinicella sp.]
MKPARTASAPAPAYLGVLRDSHDVWPMAIVGGTFRIVDGCAMVGEHLLVMPRGSTLAGLEPGTEVEGGGGEFPLASFTGRNAPWALAEPIPERCARLATRALVTVGLRDQSRRRPAPPQATPPPPVSDPASCPPGTKLSFGLCRKPDGTVVRVVERR